MEGGVSPDKARLSNSNFSKLRAIIHEKTGITIGENRKTMLTSRLRSRLREIGAADFNAYVARLANEAEEMQELINRVTTNKTYFYRTPRIWRHFSEVAVAEYRAQKQRRPMRIWSAAASSGEEAYTVGVILEDIRRSDPSFDYSVFGSDVSQRVLALAENGAYSNAAIGSLRSERPELFDAYIRLDDRGLYRAIPEIRSRIRFKPHNLNERLKNTRTFDVVFLRNVLIYFTPEDQENILRNVHEALAPGGYLYIGESETLTRLKTDFEGIEPLVYQPRLRQRTVA